MGQMGQVGGASGLVVRRTLAPGLMVAVLVACAPGTARATVELPADFDALVAGSQLVVHGRVVDVRGQQVDSRRSIETIVTVAVTEAFKGRPGTTVTFRLPGGEVGRYRRVVVGVPRLAAGDEGVFFLRGAAPALPTLFGLEQGMFRVSRPGDGRALVTPPVIISSGAVATRVVRGDPGRRPLALADFGREVRSRAEARP